MSFDREKRELSPKHKVLISTQYSTSDSRVSNFHQKNKARKLHLIQIHTCIFIGF